MIAFTNLYFELDRTTRSSDKIAALRHYFSTAPAVDAAWAAYVLAGNKIGKTVSHTRLRKWAAEVSGQPAWLLNECYTAVGDLSETLALLLPDQPNAVPPPLHEVIEQAIVPLGQMTESHQRELITGMWRKLTREQRLVFHKLLGGEFRIGVSRQTLINALAAAADLSSAIMAHRLAGHWKPGAEAFARLMSKDAAAAADEVMLPYPFMLAHALADPVEDLGSPTDWLAEWKWDGIRAQVMHRATGAGRSSTAIWSRGDELISSGFPEIVQAAGALPAGTVLDGEILAWDSAHALPLPFLQLQRRINRKNVQPSFWPEVPVAFIAFDILQCESADVRAQPLRRRRELLENVLRGSHAQPLIRPCAAVEISDWPAAQSLIGTARQRGVEGLMFKRWDSHYAVGRPTGLWWKLKIAPFTLDMVMIAAEPGHGKRAGLLTDYTFGVWADGALLPIAKAYSGLTDAEIAEVDRWARRHTQSKHGPVHRVEPTRVFEIAFEAIAPSDRHKAGLAVRFPRILRERTDKTAAAADTLETAHELLKIRAAAGAGK